MRVRVEVATLGGAVLVGVVRLDSFGYERDLLRAVSTLWDEAQGSGRPNRRSASAWCSRICVIRTPPPSSKSIVASAGSSGRSIESVSATVLEHCCGGPAAIHAGRTRGAKIAYQSFPDMARLRWLGIVGHGALEADNPRALRLHERSSGSIVRDPAST